MTSLLSRSYTNSLQSFVRRHSVHHLLIVLCGAVSLGLPVDVHADDMVTFATGGYARGLRTPEMKGKIDANGDGMISREEWIAYQEQVFVRLDTHKTGSIPVWRFINANGALLESFATGGYERGLRTREMVQKIDKNHDHRISHDEFMAYELSVFDLMDTSTDHKGLLTDENFFGQIEAHK